MSKVFSARFAKKLRKLKMQGKIQKYVDIPQKLGRAQILILRFGDRSQLKCRHCGGELFLYESYPKQKEAPT